MTGILLVLVMFTMTGCIKPYNTPELIVISPSQTAFLIPLEGNTKDNQASFDSLEFLETAKVATKRIRISKRWLQTGRFDYMGKWIPSERLVIVERKPESREWTSETNTGTSQKDEGIEAESSESIGFVIGIGITAQIDEPDATSFLYRYNNKPLKDILDDEIRLRVESKIIAECAKRTLRQIQTQKKEILDAVSNDVVKYFKSRGINISNLGYKGALTYTTPKIQEAIDSEFIADRTKAAMEKTNQMNIDIKTAEANAEKTAQAIRNQINIDKKKAEANAEKTAQDIRNKMNVDTAEAEKIAVTKRASVMKDYIKLRELDIDMVRAEKYKGGVPTHVLSPGANLLLDIK